MDELRYIVSGASEDLHVSRLTADTSDKLFTSHMLNWGNDQNSSSRHLGNPTSLPQSSF